MEHKKVYALVLTSILTLGGIMVYNSFNQKGLLGRVGADPFTYTRIFDENTGPTNPATHNGFIPNVNMSLTIFLNLPSHQTNLFA